MRNIRLLSIIIIYMTIISAQVFAQNLGIGPNTFDPDPSAGVEMRFSNKGLLIPRVALTSTTDATTIPSPATSLLVYNLGTGGLSTPGYYYNSGTSTSPNWVRLATTGLDGSGVATRVAFWSGSNTLSSNTNLYWDNTNSRLGVGTSAPGSKLDVNGVIKAHGNYYNVLSWNYNGTPTNGVKIKTNLPYTNGSQMPTILIEGYDLGAGNPIGISLVWYIYDGNFCNYKASSWGNTTPTIKLANEGGLVTIWLDWRPYYGRMNVRVYAQGMSETASWFDGWTVVDEVAGTTNQVTVPYSNSFPGTVNFASGIWNSSGNVGIGTTTPTAQLHTTGTVRFAGVGSTSTNTLILTSDANGNLSYRNAGAWAGGSDNVNGSGTATRVAFWSGTNTLSSNANLYWDNTNSRLGVGTSSPAEKLHINGSIRGDQSGALRINTGSGYIDIGPKNTSWAHFYTDRSRYWFSTGLTVETGNIGSYDEDLSLQTSGTTRITILNSNGNVGIGTTTPAAKLHVAGNIKTNTINETSDARFKKNIQSIDTPLSKVLSLRGVYFYWDLDNPDVQEIDSSKQIGMIAQEVEKILPELVNTDANGYKSVEYSRVVAVLIEAMKEQQKTIDEQKDMINDLNERITKLEELIKVK